MAKHANTRTTKKIGITTVLAGGAVALSLFGGAGMANAENEFNVQRTTDRGVVNAYPGSLVETETRGPQAARVTDSYVAELPEFTCPNVADGTDALGSKGLGAGADMIFGGACG